MSKISKSQKIFRWKQVGAYGLVAGTITAIAVPIGIYISHATKKEKQPIKQQYEQAMNESLFMTKGYKFIKAYDKDGEGWKLNKDFLKYFNTKPFDFSGIKNVDKDNEDVVKQTYLYTQNGIRVWTQDYSQLGKDDPKKEQENSFISQLLGENITFNGKNNSFMSDLLKELSKISSPYIGTRAVYFKVINYLNDSLMQFSTSNLISVGNNANKMYLISIPLAAYQVISNFINNYFNPIKTIHLTNNEKIAAKLSAINGGILNNISGSPKVIKDFLKNLSDSAVLDNEIFINNQSIKFRDFLKKGIIQNLKWEIQKNIIYHSLLLGMPLQRYQDKSLTGNGSKFISDILNQYHPIEKRGMINEGFENGQKIVFKNKSDAENIKKLLTIKTSSFIIAPTNIYDIKKASPIYFDKKWIWNGKQFKQNDSAIIKDTYGIVGDFEADKEFFWRNIGDRYFVQNTLNGIKISKENKGNFKKGFSITTDNNVFEKFKTLLNKINSGDKEIKNKILSKLFVVPSEANPSIFNYNFNKWTPNITNQSFDHVKLQIPISFYIQTISNFIKNDHLTEAQNKELIKREVFSNFSSLRWNSSGQEIKFNNKIIKDSFTLFNDNNIEIILKKVYEEIFDNGAKNFKTFLKGATDNSDTASAIRLFFKHISNKNNIDKDGYMTNFQLEQYKKAGLDKMKINNNGDAEHPGDIPKTTWYHFLSTSLATNSAISNLTLMLTIATFGINSNDVIYATEYNKWINKLQASGYDIINNSHNGFSDTLIKGATSIFKIINKTEYDLAWGGVSYNQLTSSYVGNNLIIRSNKEINYIKINNKKINVHKYEVYQKVFNSPKENGKEIREKTNTKTIYISDPIIINGFKYATINPKSDQDKDYIISFYDKNDKKIDNIIDKIYDRPPYDLNEEKTFATTEGFLSKDKQNNIVIKVFKNMKGI